MEHRGGVATRLYAVLCVLLRYTNRQPNVRYEHLLYRASDGSYLPALAVFTNTAIPAGDEVIQLTTQVSRCSVACGNVRSSSCQVQSRWF